MPDKVTKCIFLTILTSYNIFFLLQFSFTKLGCFRHGRPGGEGSGLAAGFVGKVLVWLGGKGYGQGYRVMVMLMVRLGRYGYGLASWVGFSGMVMVRLRG